MTARYTFGDVTSDWRKFTQDATAWKPKGFDDEMGLRLRYFLDQQLDDTRTEMKRRFPETHDKMVAVTLPITRHFVREQAKVFLSSTKLDLVQGKEAAPTEVSDWWEETRRKMALALKLKRVDAYTTLMRTCGLKIGHQPGRFTAQVVFPQNIRVVMDPEAPMELDRAHGVAVEVASDQGVSGTGGTRRWEFWCARKGEEQHLIVEETGGGEGATAKVVSRDEGDPLKAPDGRTVVPLVLFAAHTEELGLFTLEGSDLVQTNRGLNILVTDIHNIAEAQGFGLLVLTTRSGSKPPAKIVRSPNTAIALDEGVEAEMMTQGAQLDALLTLADTRIKQSAVLYGIPAGSVSIEARAAASGIALQIEMRPLLELRADAIEVYRDPMARIWDLIWATHNAYASEELGEDAVTIPEDVELRWTPGEILAPADDVQKTDNLIAKLKAKLLSRVEAIAQDRGISVDEARKVMTEIDAEKDTLPADQLGVPDPTRALLGLRGGGRGGAAGARGSENLDLAGMDGAGT